MTDNYDIFTSEYTAEQIEDEIENGVPYIDSTTKHWMRWDIDSQSFVDTGIVAEGVTSGDMLKSVYDSNNAVANAGGITNYVGAYHDSTKQDNITSSNKLSADLISNGSTNKVVTQSEKNTWNNKGTYSKPSGGIPDSDIASAATWNAKAPGYQYSTTDLTAGSSSLTTGTLYFVYE